MRNKKIRFILRLSLLLIMISAITYTLYQHFFTEKKQVQVGGQILLLVLEDMEGNKVQLSDLKGKEFF